MPPGSTFVRLRFATDATRKRLGYDTVALEPLFHVDARVAARRKLLDVSDYQALTRLFPVDHKPLISEAQRFQLWDLEGSGTTSMDSLRQILKSFPIPIDYVVVLGDRVAQEQIREFESGMRLVAVNPGEPFIRIFRR
jgi:hypothetical protein